MGESTKIEWCDHTFNPWWGCQRVSPGCEHCYAETFSRRVGLKVWGPTSERRFFGDKHWAEPLKWDRRAAKDGVRRRVFCASMADVFEDRGDLDEHRTRLCALIRETPSLDWLLLTKRPENIRKLWPEGVFSENVWLGTTAEDQAHYSRRWPHLATAASEMGGVITFVSYEPALGPLSLTCNGCDSDIRAHRTPDQGGCSGWFPDWVIIGGESGPGAREFQFDWARRVIEDCRSSPIAVFFKQFGSKPALGVTPYRFTDRKGGDWTEWPPYMRVRECPVPLVTRKAATNG
jgi:protein gp37